MVSQRSKVGRKGTVAIPESLRRLFGLAEGDEVIAEGREDGILIRPANGSLPEPEVYSPERIAEFLLSNSLDAEDYAAAVTAVRELGLDPDQILHHKPPGV